MSNSNQQDRIAELLSEEAVFGLSPEERTELDDLLASAGGIDESSYDQAAAAYFLAAAPLETESLPASLRSTLLDTAKQQTHPPAIKAQPSAVTTRRATVEPNRQPARNVAWLLAVAASLVIGFLVGAPGGAEKDPRVARNKLIESENSLTRIAWVATDDPAGAGAEGEVVWSDTRQQGYMTFRGLAVNDPKVEQYQLWIFDAERDDRYPVDGGVFNVPTGADEVVQEIDPKIAVNKAVMFAVTVEKPGGVVVSDRSRLPLLAKSP